MPMNADLMATAIISHMPKLEEAAANEARRASIVAICKGVIEHIQAAAQINGAVGPGLANGFGPVAGTLIVGPGGIT
jgi:hypothetical protein